MQKKKESLYATGLQSPCQFRFALPPAVRRRRYRLSLPFTRSGTSRNREMAILLAQVGSTEEGQQFSDRLLIPCCQTMPCQRHGLGAEQTYWVAEGFRESQ